MADIKLFAVENDIGVPLTFQNLETPKDGTTLPAGRGYTPGGNGKGEGCDVPNCPDGGSWSGHRMVLQSPDNALSLNLFKNGATLSYSQGDDYPATPAQVPGTPDTGGQRNLLTIAGTTSAPQLTINVLPYSYYRLELWFDWNDPTAKVGWGVTRSPDQMSGSPTVLDKSNGVVQLYDASVSELDIIVYDASADAPAGGRTLENIELDFENVSTTGGSNATGNAATLRSGQSGAAFAGSPQNGLRIYSYPGGPRASQCGWDSKQSYQKLADGNYTFTGVLRVTSGTVRKQFSIDPEMDISG